MNKNAERLKELMNDESFVKEFITRQEPEDVQVFLEEHGVELSLDEVKQMGSLLEKVAKGEIKEEQLINAANGELSEEELEDVAGGVAMSALTLTLIIVGSALGSAGTTTAALAIDHYKNEIVDWFKSW